MALSATDICNLALARIGEEAIMDITDDSIKSARACNVAFEPVAREVARMGEWNCLKKRVALAQIAEAPAFEWEYQYQLPSDFISLVEVNGSDYHGQAQDKWEIEGRVLLTDAETANIRYIAYVEDTAQWDSLFSNAVAVLLAARIAVLIRQDENLATALIREFESVALPRARMKDGNERRVRRFDPTLESRFIAARHFSTNG